MSTEIRMLQNEVDRGPAGPAAAGMVLSLNIAWAPFNEKYRKVTNIKHGYKTYVERAGRLAVLSHVVGRGLGSSADLTQGEAQRILRWLGGHHPGPNVNVGEEERERCKALREVEVVAWMTSPPVQAEIAEAAQALRVAKLRA